MKKTFFVAIVIMLALASCKKEKKTGPTEIQEGILVLNEGSWGGNNSSITYYNFDSTAAFQDVFLEKNGRNLGELGNDIAQYGAKIYILVGGSSQIEVTDLSLQSVAQIPLMNGNVTRQPQNIAFHENKAYIACYDGYVCKLDTASLVVDGYLQVGKNPADLCVSNGKLYVSNSGGADSPTYDSTVSVINLNTFTEIKKITVGMNPGTIEVDERGYVYVGCRGNYSTIMPSFHQIDPNTDEKVQTYDNIKPANFFINKNNAYVYGTDFSTMTTSYSIFNLVNGQETNTNFKGSTEVESAYGAFYNSATEEIYISDAIDFSNSGKIYAIKNGVKTFEFNTGISPKKMIVLKK